MTTQIARYPGSRTWRRSPIPSNLHHFRTFPPSILVHTFRNPSSILLR